MKLHSISPLGLYSYRPVPGVLHSETNKVHLGRCQRRCQTRVEPNGNGALCAGFLVETVSSAPSFFCAPLVVTKLDDWLTGWHACMHACNRMFPSNHKVFFFFCRLG